MARDLADEPPGGTGTRVGLRDRRQAVEIEPGVGDVLIGGEPAQPFGHEISRAAEARGLGLEVAWERGRLARLRERNSGRDARAPRPTAGPSGTTAPRRSTPCPKPAQSGARRPPRPDRGFAQLRR